MHKLRHYSTDNLTTTCANFSHVEIMESHYANGTMCCSISVYIAADQSSVDNVLLAVDKASATNIVQIIKPTYHEEIPKKPLSAYQCMSLMGNSELCAPISKIR